MRNFAAASVPAGLLGFFVLCCAASHAQEGEVSDKAYLELAEARARVDIALQAARDTMDEHKSGWRERFASGERGVERTLDALKEAQEREKNRPKDQRDEAFMAECERLRDGLEASWDESGAVALEGLERQYEDAREAYSRARDMSRSLGEIENEWKDQDLPPELLTPLYKALEGRVSGAKGQAQDALAELKVQNAQWQEQAEKAMQYAASHLPK